VLSSEPLPCRDDGDCRSSLRCELNYCTTPSTNQLQLQARITPRGDAGLVQQQVPALRLDGGPAITVTLLAPTELRGTVRPADDPFTLNVAGEIELRADGPITGLEYRYTARSLSGLDNRGDGFAMTVLPGQNYRGVFRPDDNQWPRVFFQTTAETIAQGRLDIVLPAKEAIATVSGRVRLADYTPINGARIVILSAAGEVLGRTVTDTERGRFSLAVVASFSTVDARIEPPENSNDFPEFRVSGLIVAADLDLVAPTPAADAGLFDAAIEVVSIAGEVKTPAPGVPVTIVGVLAGGTVRLSTTTDSDGVARFRTFPGAYECLVSSPAELPTASWHGYITLTPPPPGITQENPMIRLAARPVVRLNLFDFEGLPVTAGAVVFERVPSRGADDELVIAPEPFFAELNGDGQVELRVDPGTYDVRIAPDTLTGAPLTNVDGITVDSAGVDLAWTLPSPGLLHLTVAGPDGTWLPDATVELWTPSAERGPRLLGRGKTNANGFWDVLVPHVSAP